MQTQSVTIGLIIMKIIHLHCSTTSTSTVLREDAADSILEPSKAIAPAAPPLVAQKNGKFEILPPPGIDAPVIPLWGNGKFG